MLSTQELILTAIIAAAVFAILTERLRSDVASICVLIALGVTGILTPEEALSGFSQPPVIALISLFILARALEETGVVAWMGERLRSVGGGSERRLILGVMLSAVALAAFMNLVAVAALLLPAVVQAARQSRLRPSRLLIPLSFGALLGGTATYFATANLIIGSILAERGYAPLTPTTLLPTGALIVIAGIAYMLLIGRRLLPDRESASGLDNPNLLSRRLYETYQLEERLWEFVVMPGSRLAGVTLSDSRIGAELGVTVLAIWRGHHALLTPEPSTVIAADDYLLILGREERVTQLVDWGLRLGRANGGDAQAHEYAVDLTEVIIPPRSTVAGKTLTDLRFRSKHRLTTVALWRGGRSYRTDVGRFPLQIGDALLMVGSPAQIAALTQEQDYLVVQSGHPRRPRSVRKALIALAIFLAAVLMALLRIVPPPEALLAGAVGVVLAGCLNMDEAYRAVEWRVIFFVAGMLPLSAALIQTGLAGRVGGLLVEAFAPFGVLPLLAVLYLLTVAIAQAIGGQVTAVVAGSVIIAAAAAVGIDPTIGAVVAATACATCFLTPTAHAVNQLVLMPGGYRSADFARVGAGLTVVTFVTLMLGLVVVWGVR